MRLTRCCRTLLLGAMLTATAPAHAQVTAGGTGGAPFPMLSCPPGEFLLGISGDSGWYIDSITIFCAAYAADGSFILTSVDENEDDNMEPDASVSTGGGTDVYSQICDSNQVVNRIDGRADWYVDSISAMCSFTDGSGSGFLGPDGGDGGSPYQLPCPPGQAVTGITGRSGWWIDQIGIQCGNFCVQPPNDVELLAPAAGTGGPQPTFTWTAAGSGAVIGVSFDLCVFTIPFDSCDILQQTVNGTVFTPAQPLDFPDGESVAWAVRALNTCGGAGEFSESRLLDASDAGDVSVGNLAQYIPLCDVYKDDRCAICHGVEAPPGHPIPFPIDRFDDDTCTGCHSVTHVDPVTGAETAVWEFPPVAAEEIPGVDLQFFADPATCGDICRSVRNWAEEHDFLHHIEDDPLVLYGFDPSTVVNNDALAQKLAVEAMSHAEYVSLSERWYRAGMPCDPVNDIFGGVAAAQAPDGGSDGSRDDTDGERIKGPDTGLVPVPEVKPAWWIVPDGEGPDYSKLPPNEGIPTECRALYRIDTSKFPRKHRQKLIASKFDELYKECQRIIQRKPVRGAE